MTRNTTQPEMWELRANVRFAQTQAEAQVALDRLNEHGDRTWRLGEQKRGEWEYHWLPQVGEGVIAQVGNDRSWFGRITRVTRTTFTTDEGHRFTWSAKRRIWCRAGTAGWSRPVLAGKGEPTDTHRDPHS